jgi:hypothetical protein
MMVMALLLFPVTNTLLAFGENWETSAQELLSAGYKLGQTLNWLTILGSNPVENQPALNQTNGYPAADSDNARCNGEASRFNSTFAVAPLPAPSVEDEDAVSASGLCSSSACTNIGGSWKGSEQGNVCCTIEGESECFSVGGSGLPVNINQDGCSIGYAI